MCFVHCLWDDIFFYFYTMIKKIAITAILVSITLFFNSCGNETTVQDTTSTGDSTKVNTPEALAKLNDAIAKDPKNAELLHQRAQYFLEQQQINDGITDMIAALNIDSSKSVYYMTISDLYFLGNKTGKSKLALERAISLDAKNVDAMLKLAELYLYVAKHDKSMEYINMALKVDMYNSKGYFMKGMNYKELKDTAKAISSMQTAVEQDQQYYQAFMQLGLLCAAQKNSLAVQYYKNAIRLNPKSTEAIYGLGKYYQDIEDYANALTCYKSILDYEQNPNVHYNIGAIHLGNTRKYDLALTHFSDAIKIDPKYTDAYFARGVTYEKMGNKKSAIADYQACLAISPDYQLAKIALQKLGVK